MKAIKMLKSRVFFETRLLEGQTYEIGAYNGLLTEKIARSMIKEGSAVEVE